MKTLSENISPKFVIQARKLAKYTQLLHQILPIECRGHVEVANIRNQNLMLITDSPVWTTKLRQLSPQILQFVRENSPNTDTSSDKSQIIHHVQISTRYNPAGDQQYNKQEQKKPAPTMSQKAAQMLAQSANSINSEKLKASLQRIARNGTHNKDSSSEE